jgi:transposase
VPVIPSWLLEPLWDQFAALLPDRPVYAPSHPLGCHRLRIADRIIFEKLIQVLRFGCSYASIADCTCGATTIRERRDEWIKAGIFANLKTIARESYDRMVGLVLEELAVDGCITKAPGGGECAGPSPVDRRKLGMKRSLLVEGYGIPLGRVWPRRTGTTPRCWPPRWTNSTTSARCPRTSPSTSTPDTTHRRPATSSANAR